MKISVLFFLCSIAVGLKITSPNLELQSFGGADKKALAPHAGSEPESEKKALAPQAESEPEAKKKAPAPALAPEAETPEKKASVPEVKSEPEAESEPEGSGSLAASGSLGVPTGASPAPAPAPFPETTITTTCADNFADEVVDQANVEFGMVDKDKDGCILPHEMTESLQNQVRASKKRNYPWQVMNITEDHFIFVEESYRRLRKADVNNDGCVNKTEFEELHHELCDCDYQFLMMDHNADGKISRQEAATFVSDHMSQADLSYAKLRDIFDAADVDGDKFLSEPEFCEAGPRYQGDGDGK